MKELNSQSKISSRTKCLVMAGWWVHFLHTLPDIINYFVHVTSNWYLFAWVVSLKFINTILLLIILVKSAMGQSTAP